MPVDDPLLPSSPRGPMLPSTILTPPDTTPSLALQPHDLIQLGPVIRGLAHGTAPPTSPLGRVRALLTASADTETYDARGLKVLLSLLRDWTRQVAS